MRPLTAILAAIAAIAAGSCNRSADTPIPRRTAYPRIEAYADSTATAHIGPLAFDIAAQADTAMPRPGWLDIAYPRYRATIHIAVRHLGSGEELADAIDNRVQRMSLNLGDRTAVASDFENSAGFSCHTVTSLDGGPTPVQFMAYSADGYLLSGAAAISGAAGPADSIAPTVQALARDAETILKSLRRE